MTSTVGVRAQTDVQLTRSGVLVAVDQHFTLRSTVAVLPISFRSVVTVVHVAFVFFFGHRVRISYKTGTRVRTMCVSFFFFFFFFSVESINNDRHRQPFPPWREPWPPRSRHRESSGRNVNESPADRVYGVSMIFFLEKFCVRKKFNACQCVGQQQQM